MDKIYILGGIIVNRFGKLVGMLCAAAMAFPTGLVQGLTAERGGNVQLSPELRPGRE